MSQQALVYIISVPRGSPRAFWEQPWVSLSPVTPCALLLGVTD